ncbi:DNA kinase/phosphatase Pnk1 [Coemansia erecta]|uniref:DNA kinase/phosphatase Pnk1 n=1 Tax=Coemansia asiatica TaxID=1052880 RepID=A0A9W8CI03_9FUNG|nr:DNA kinase/phosphatase Pnk1 [Coemansia asiatica]KAJ2855508.1 DNA kinase/phosphatase Pnk1 [Coemansia erecta]KAJ2880076.1 DNA kinase/phosphatase Pnk1 [Coemansia asiatica]
MTATKPGKRNHESTSMSSPNKSGSSKKISRADSGKGTQQKSLNSFFKTSGSDAKKASQATGDGVAAVCKRKGSLIQWREFEQTWLGTFKSPEPATKFAAFDLDGTLINVKGNWVHPKSANDWRFYHKQVPAVLRRMYDQGYKIVIISNQNGLRQIKGAPKLTKRSVEYLDKIDQIARLLDIPFTILTALDKNYMRKPSPGMWFMAEMDNGGLEVDRVNSFFVGDAAGRPAGWRPGVAEDFSDSDLAFARNAGVPFYTPEEVFNDAVFAKEEPLPLPEPQQLSISRFHPSSLVIDNGSLSDLVAELETEVILAQKESKGILVILVGPPASGKSTFSGNQLGPLGFEQFAMDAKTRKKCEAAVKEALVAGRYVVVDNTNPDETTRGSFVKIAAAAGARSIAVVFGCETRELANHNNVYRSQLLQARYLSKPYDSKQLHLIPTNFSPVPPVAFHTFFKRLTMPNESEGFSKIFQHVFVPSFLRLPSDEALWNQYY